MRPRFALGRVATGVLRTQPDDRLVDLVRAGNEGAFATIADRYRTGLVCFARGYVPSGQAEDVVQDALVSAWEALRDSDREIALKSWLYTIVRNRALNARRDARPTEPLDESIDGVRQPSDILLMREQLRRVVGAVDALPRDQRRALVRSAADGHTHAQIAVELQTTEGAVRGMIHRGRATVREIAASFVPAPLVGLLARGAETGVVSGLGGGAAAGASSLIPKGAAVALAGLAGLASGVALDRAVLSGVEGRGGPPGVEALSTPGADEGQAPSPDAAARAAAAASGADRAGGGTRKGGGAADRRAVSRQGEDAGRAGVDAVSAGAGEALDTTAGTLWGHAAGVTGVVSSPSSVGGTASKAAASVQRASPVRLSKLRQRLPVRLLP